MPKRYPKLIHTLVCDDIRHEEGNKSSFIGVFRSSVLTIPKPYIISKLCFILTFGGVRHRDNLNIKMVDPEGKEVASINPVEFTLPKKGSHKVTIEICFGNIKIKKAGEYQLLFSFGEDEKAKTEVKFQIKKKKG